MDSVESFTGKSASKLFFVSLLIKPDHHARTRNENFTESKYFVFIHEKFLSHPLKTADESANVSESIIFVGFFNCVIFRGRQTMGWSQHEHVGKHKI